MYEIYLKLASSADIQMMKNAFERSKHIHLPWVYQPDDYKRYIENQIVYLLARIDNDELIGCFSLSGIMRGNFQSAYLGYQVFHPFENKGYMTKGIRLLFDEVFNVMKLHRLEANIQPKNIKSINFISKVGFNKEGYSPEYLKINNIWEDHERWAIINRNC